MSVAAALPCPVCGTQAPFAYPHPEANIYRCSHCTHAFSDPASVAQMEYSADYYEEAHRNWFANPNLKLFAWIESQIPSTACSVIDVGCGKGQFLDFLRSKRPNIRLVGVDLSDNENRNGIEFHHGDALGLNLGEFDAVVSLAAIEHVADGHGFVSLLHKLCSPGGMIFVMTLDDSSILYRTGRLARLFGVPLAFNRLYSAHHYHHFTNKSLVELICSAGFQVRKTLHHSVPVRAIDVPVQNPVFRPVFLTAAAALLAAGDVTGLSYLQTVVAIRPTAS